MTTSHAARQSLISLVAVTKSLAAKASTLKSDHIRGLRVLLTAAQGNICAGCGLSLAGARVEVCHIGAYAYGTGIVPRGVYAGCKECNDYDREVCEGDTTAIITHLVRPDLVATAHPDRQACLMAAKNDRKAQVWSRRQAAAMGA